MEIKNKIKVLIVDDSQLVLDILSKGLSADTGIEVVGTAPDVYVARDMIVRLRPDVMTLDIEMPKMDGLEFLKRLMPQFPLPVVVVSSLTQKGQATTFRALELGAVDFIGKPKSSDVNSLNEMIIELRTKVKIASTSNVSHWKHSPQKQYLKSNLEKKILNTNITNNYKDKIIAIGASTGGTEAIKEVISELPPYIPGILIVQHMPSGFTKTFADRLNELSYISVREAKTGDNIESGVALIAPGDYHVKLVKNGTSYQVVCYQGEKVNGHRPAVDPMMQSVAECYGKNAMGLILTGMGADGAKGLKEMRDNGAYTIGQNEESSIVYGMPKVAYEMGAVEKQLPLKDICKQIIKHFNT